MAARTISPHERERRERMAELDAMAAPVLIKPMLPRPDWSRRGKPFRRQMFARTSKDWRGEREFYLHATKGRRSLRQPDPKTQPGVVVGR